ncbi:ABC transporter-related protein [Pyrolobus fumarii 1A]|uniref:ABC transporter-related protein n=1 Tax=Pyrolobus fumarii (strain DSM 11204 / 1A) TaxID=694429 RepID=G0EHQ9_PYRF1|nr:GNAT family N-acetyltransferase [Pyrolobus fumarii]AEM39412.1 ABC transporter-related protein [Pyrolobus fumarii 1A]
MHQDLPILVPFEARVVSAIVPRVGYRWVGGLVVEYNGVKIHLLMPAAVARWLSPGEKVRVRILEEPTRIDGAYIVPRDAYELDRWWDGEWVKVWPPWSKSARLVRYDPLRGEPLYEYHVVAREAITESDYREIVSLEQYHYASKEEIVAIWRCPVCGKFFESNVQPICPEDRVPAKLQEIRGSLPSSRFLVLELVNRRPYEPRIVAYVRIDTPIPLMHRRIIENGVVKVEKFIRERVFPKDWFHPTFWPLAYSKRQAIIARYRELLGFYKSKRLARAAVGEEIAEEALKRANTAAARIARVVVHPDYRGDGLGVLAVKMALEWVRERRVPEMKRRKHVVETIAQMARYNPFFEKAGFVYMWDTASGRPVLMYPLSDEARKRIEWFLRTDPYARRHGGRLYRPRYGRVEPLEAPVRLVKVTKLYRSELDLSRLPPELQEILKAFGVERRVVERHVLRDVNIEINPGEVVVVIGASGAGKTTLLRMIIGAAAGIDHPDYKPNEGKVEVPSNTRIEYLLPGEHEPEFGNETLLEHITRKTGDPALAVEILNAVGLSDAIFYRARFAELSTGQKERAKLASLLASKPNLLVIDEFAAHLDALTAQRVARKLAQLARNAGITLVVATNRAEVIKALSPDKVIFVGYGTAYPVKYDESILRNI